MSRLHELDAYLTGELPDGDALDALEEAMFDAPDDADLVFFDQLAIHGRQLVDHGTWFVGITKRDLDALFAAGHDIQLLSVSEPGSLTNVAFSPTAKLFATHLRVDTTDELVDVDVTLLDQGNITKTIRDVRVDGGSIYGLCERALAHIAYGTGRVTATVRRRDGSRSALAEYHFAPTL